MNSNKLFINILYCCVSAFIVSFAFHYFANANAFAPGGISGLASMTSYLTKTSMAYYMILYNLPIFLVVFFIVNKKTALMLIIYMSFQALFLFLLEFFKFPQYIANDNLIFAAIATGIVSGAGFSIMLKRFNASGGTYAIASIIRRFKPDKNLAWVAFVMDASVLFLAFFVYGFNINASMCTLINLFVANMVVDYILQGIKTGYKLEIITSNPQLITSELLKLGYGVTKLQAIGMYTLEEKVQLICVVRKRDMGNAITLLKKYPDCFTTITKISEVMGKFYK